jgi:hypothetical protein
MPRPARAAFVLLVLAAATAAQRTFIVDAAGGAGSDFRTIQPALDAAAHGDLILVRLGTYAEDLLITKGVRLVGEAGARVEKPVAGPSVRISSLPAGRKLVLQGLTFLETELRVETCAGEVVLDWLRFDARACCYLGSSVRVQDSAQVVLRSVTLRGQGVSCGRSALAIVDSSIASIDYHIGTAILLDNAIVSIAGSTVLGGGFGYRTVHMVDSTLSVARSTVIRNSIIGYAVLATRGRIDIDPSVVLRTTGDPPVAGTATVTWRPIPACAVSGFASGGRADLQVLGPSGSPFCVFVGEPAPVATTRFGFAWLDLGRAAVVSCQVVGTNGSYRYSFATPVGLPLGAVLAVQAAMLIGPGVELSEPGFAIVRISSPGG